MFLGCVESPELTIPEPTEDDPDPVIEDPNHPADDTVDDDSLNVSNLILASPASVPMHPDQVTRSYLQMVMDSIDEVLEAGVSQFDRSGSSDDPDVVATFESIYDSELADHRLAQLTGGVEPYHFSDHPARPSTQVADLLDASTSCAYFTALRYPDVVSDWSYAEPELLHHLRLELREPDEINPTAWEITLALEPRWQDDAPPAHEGCDGR